MYVKGHIIGKLGISMMMIMGATHNFILEGEARNLSLKLEKNLSHMKVVNFKAFTTMGVVKQVLVKLGTW